MRCEECDNLHKNKEGPKKNFCLIAREYLYDIEKVIDCQNYIDKIDNNRPKKFMHSKDKVTTPFTMQQNKVLKNT